MNQESTFKKTDQDDCPRFTYFACAWAIAAYFHQLGWANWFDYKLTHVYILCTILVLLKPRSLSRFHLFIGVSIVHVFKHSPNIANHLTFELLTNISIFTVLVISFLFKKSVTAEREVIYSRIAPIVRCNAILLYVFAFLAKLNWDFFIPHNSCAMNLFTNLTVSYPILSSEILKNTLTAISVVWLTILLELLLPLLLIIKRTRTFAIIFGIGFHFIMGLLIHKGVFSFSMLFLVIYMLFLPDEAFKKLNNLCSQIIRRFEKLIPHLMIRQCVIVLCVYLPQIAHEALNWHYLYGIKIWYFVYPVMAAIYIKSVLGTKSDNKRYRDYFFPKPAYFLVLFIPLLVNGFAPYLGIKTQGSMTMFSNLRVLGEKPNHIFMPRSMRVVDQDLIKIVDSNQEKLLWYKEAGNYITEFEFRRIISEDKGSYQVVFEYNGRTHTLDSAINNRAYQKYFQPIPFLKRHIIKFKSVDQGEHARCRW